jgi:protein involved in ribonucleotide reduction
MLVVFFSSVSENTSRFVEKLDIPAVRIPLKPTEELPEIDEPFVLITPTYGAGGKGFVPKQVVRLLNVEAIRNNCVGVVGSGNINFMEDYCKAAYIVSAKLNVPVLYTFELAGTEDDVHKVTEGMKLIGESHH